MELSKENSRLMSSSSDDEFNKIKSIIEKLKEEINEKNKIINFQYSTINKIQNEIESSECIISSVKCKAKKNIK